MIIAIDTYLHQYYYIRYNKNTCTIIFTSGSTLMNLHPKYKMDIRINVKNTTILSNSIKDVRKIKCQKRSSSFYRGFVDDPDMFIAKETE